MRKMGPARSTMIKGMSNVGRLATPALSSTSAAASPAASTAASAAPSMASQAMNVAKNVVSNPIAKAAGASYALGQAATGTETGRAIGKKIGDTFPALKSAMSKVKDFRDKTIAPKLGMKSLSTAAKTPYISNAIKSVTGGDTAKAAPAKTEPSTFKQAFAAARKEAGSGKGQFSWKGKQYQTNINPAKGAEKYISAKKQSVTSVGKTTEPTTSVKPAASTTPGSTNIAAQPAPPTSATKGISDTAAKVGISQTPATKSTEFGANKTLAPLPTKSNVPTPSTSTPSPAPSMAASDKSPSTAMRLPSNLGGSTQPSSPSGTSTAPRTMPSSLSGSSPTPAPTPPTPSMVGGGASNNAGEGEKKMKAMASLKEEVQVGDYKYRIV